MQQDPECYYLLAVQSVLAKKRGSGAEPAAHDDDARDVDARVDDASRRLFRYLGQDVVGPGPRTPGKMAEAVRLARELVSARQQRSHIPSGYTYFGQFVTHDLAEFPREGESVNLRTPRLDLDCLYEYKRPASDASDVSPPPELLTEEGFFKSGGLGVDPRRGPCVTQVKNLDLINDRPVTNSERDLLDHEFDRERQQAVCDAQMTCEGQDDCSVDIPQIARFDLPRRPDGKALIGDPRNDQNMIIGELHRAMMRAHDAIMRVEGAAAAARRAELSLSDYARRELTRHYQWVVFHDFLPRLLSLHEVERLKSFGPHLEGAKETVSRISMNKDEPTISAEFATAAFRFGHTMPREKYRLGPGTSNITFIPIRTELAKQQQRGAHLLGGDDLLPNWEVDWGFFLEMPDELRSRHAPDAPQMAMKIGRSVAPSLHNIPLKFEEIAQGMREASGHDVNPNDVDLPFLTLATALARQVPSGPVAADELEIPRVTDEDLPLWIYCLLESEREESASGERRLGRVASKITLDTFIAAMVKDEESLVHAPSGWRPWAWRRPSNHDAPYTLADLLMIGSEAVTDRSRKLNGPRSSSGSAPPPRPPRSGEVSADANGS